jgi:uncharacterized membrane protein
VGLRLVSPLLFVGVRLMAAAALLGLAMVARRRSWAALRRRWYHLAVAGALVNGVTLSAFHVGMVTENVAVMALMQSLSPMLIALSAVPLLGERLRASQWLGLILGTVGVAIVVAPRALESPAGWRAIALGLAGVAGLAGGTLYFRRFCGGVPLLAATTVQVAAGAILTACLALGFERMHAVWTAPAVTAVVWNVRPRGLDRGHGALLLPAGARDGGPGVGQLLPRPGDGGAGRVGAPGGAPDPAGRRRLRDRLRGRVPGGPRPRTARAPAPAQDGRMTALPVVWVSKSS